MIVKIELSQLKPYVWTKNFIKYTEFIFVEKLK